MWITNGPQADTLVVYAGPTQAGPRGITAFWSKAKGLPHRSSTSSACAAVTPASSSENARAHWENVPAAWARRILMSGLDYEDPVLAAAASGIMQDADIVVPPSTTSSSVSRSARSS
jgi:alkylation response protein AidB-like acyl-CoA dehydrogenase